jgi:hypothetical protein
LPILLNSENTIEIITFDQRAIIKNPEPGLRRFTAWIGRVIGGM